MWKMSAIHIQLENMTALGYLLKMGGTKNPDLMQILKEIWEFVLGQGITITAKHLLGNLNCEADWGRTMQNNHATMQTMQNKSKVVFSKAKTALKEIEQRFGLCVIEWFIVMEQISNLKLKEQEA